jgi:hypothetical protein
MPAYADALSRLPFGYSGAKFIDYSGDLMAWNAGVLNAGPLALLGEDITVAHAAGLYLDADLTLPGRRDLAVGHLNV